ncbi:putative effector protein [Blumeria hordei DH14]|uniref:Putative effector protein n=1 Tax=Blumeria graminis f. sp. hordei (strain DH14) TaxID=546991 RepID=N1JEY6_BLUG1|nr:putative effector protein [Blumeria hordei DH14]
MNCLLAILLLTGKTPKVNDRLAIIGFEGDGNLYEMYNPNGMRQFHSVEASNDIMMARSPTNGAGTYITIYCSPSEKITDLTSFITKGATRVPNGPQEGFQQDQESELKCYNHVQAELENAGRQFAILDKDLVRNGQCTQSILYSLQFQGKIACITPDKKTNAPHDDYSGKVVFNEYFQMESVVLKSSFLMTHKTSSVQFGLAWHQGNLKLFSRKSGTLIWRPVNNLKQVSEDPKYIINFLVNSFLELGLIRTELNMGKHTPHLIPESGQHSGSSRVSARRPDFKALLTKLGNHNLKFSETTAKGFLGPEMDKYSKSY